jgi:hypothetical protein
MMRNGAVTQKFDFEIASMALGVDAADGADAPQV